MRPENIQKMSMMKRNCILLKIPKKSIIKTVFILKREAENKANEDLLKDAIFGIKRKRIKKVVLIEYAKLRASRSFVPYVPHVRICLRACVPSCLCFVRALDFLRALRALIC